MQKYRSEYSSTAIKQHIQDKLNEALKANGFEEGLINVGVGDVHTGVVGANDGKAINFKLDSAIAVPGEGKYLIDGIGGNAAFEIFYSTDGELIPAYIMGSKNVISGVTISENEGELTFNVDADSYNISLEAKEYTHDELLEALNTKLAKAIEMISSIRGTFGSVQNRLEHAINNNENTHENTTAAESRIRDTDMSEAMLNLSKQNILQEVGHAMLAQANSSKNDVLKLLQ